MTQPHPAAVRRNAPPWQRRRTACLAHPPPPARSTRCCVKASSGGRFPASPRWSRPPDSILYSGAFGKRDSASGVDVQPDSIFAIASMTKAITSVAAMQLVERGKLKLDEPVARHLPELGKLDVIAGVRCRRETGAASGHQAHHAAASAHAHVRIRVSRLGPRRCSSTRRRPRRCLRASWLRWCRWCSSRARAGSTATAPIGPDVWSRPSAG